MKEKLFFKTRKGMKLCGILSDPCLNEEAPIITLCHGFSTSKDGRTYVRLEEILNDNALATFRFDFFGHGESEGAFENITISEAVENIHAALHFVKESKYKKLGLFGSSFGGMASIIEASKIKDLFVLALKSPVSDYLGLVIARDHNQKIREWKEKGFIHVTGSDGCSLRLNYSFFKDAEKMNGYASASQITCPTLIVHGDKDETVPIKQSQKTMTLLKNGRLEIIKGADHIYSKEDHFEKMLESISDHIIQHSR